MRVANLSTWFILVVALSRHAAASGITGELADRYDHAASRAGDRHDRRWALSVEWHRLEALARLEPGGVNREAIEAPENEEQLEKLGAFDEVVEELVPSYGETAALRRQPTYLATTAPNPSCALRARRKRTRQVIARCSRRLARAAGSGRALSTA